jgi:hypothetical protein
MNQSAIAPVMEVPVAVLNEREWEKWLQKGREREAITDQRSTVAMALLPFAAALVWFLLRP